jgi:hypothetical protein
MKRIRTVITTDLNQYVLELCKDDKDLYDILDYCAISAIRKSKLSQVQQMDYAKALIGYTQMWRSGKADTQSILSSTLPAMLRVGGGDLPNQLELLKNLDILVLRLIARNISGVSLMQRSIPDLCDSVRMSAPALNAVLLLGANIAAKGIDPRHPVGIGARACHVVAGNDNEALVKLLTALGEFALNVDNYGIGGFYPLLTGLQAMSEHYVGDAEAFIEAINELFEFCLLLQQQGMTPYQTVEYGITAAFNNLSENQSIRDAILPLARAQAERGFDPHLLLFEGVGNLLNANEYMVDRSLTAMFKAIGNGADIGPFMGYTSGIIWGLSSIDGFTADMVMDLFEENLALAVVINNGDFQPLLTFRYAMQHILRYPKLSPAITRHTMNLARRLAEAAIDPGPVLEHGYGMVMWKYEPDEAGHRQIMDASLELIDLGYSPLTLLQYGVPALLKFGAKEATDLKGGLARITRLYGNLQQQGVDADALVSYGIHQLARNLGNDKRQLFDILERIENLGTTLARKGLPLQETLQSGIPALGPVMDRHPDLTAVIFNIAGKLANAGVAPIQLLNAGLNQFLLAQDVSPIVLSDWLENFADVVLDYHKKQITPETSFAGMLAKLGYFKTTDDAPMHFLNLALTNFIAEGVDASTALTFGFPALWQEDLADAEREYLLDSLKYLLMRFNRSGVSSLAMAMWGMAVFFRFVRQQDTDLKALIDLYLEMAQHGAELPTDSLMFSHVAVIAAAGSDHFSQFAKTVFMLQPQPDQAYASWEMAIKVAFLQQSVITQYSMELEPLFAALLVLAEEANMREHIAERDFKEIVDLCFLMATSGRDVVMNLEYWIKIVRNDVLGPVLPEAVRTLYYKSKFLQEVPQAWRDLMLPTIMTHGQRAMPLIFDYFSISDHLSGKKQRAFIREIITQKGVQSQGIVHDLLVAGLNQGFIGDLGSEADTLNAYLEEFQYSSPELYNEYRDIQADNSLDTLAKSNKQKALAHKFNAMHEAVVKGEITPEQLAEPNLANVVYKVFPPAASVALGTYANILRHFNDYPEHTANRPDGNKLWTQNVIAGAYGLRPDAKIDLSPWQYVRTLLGVTETPAPKEPMDAMAIDGLQDREYSLGEKLFENWLNGSLGKEKNKGAILAEIYDYDCVFHDPLPYHLDEVGSLLKYREFLTDNVRETIIAALHSCRYADEERYRRQAIHKLAPPARMGPGLRKSIRKTVRSYQDKELEEKAALERLQRQLRGFDSENKLADLLEASEESLVSILNNLRPGGIEADVDQVPERVLKDLVGSEMAAIEKELFGGHGEGSKLVYNHSAGAGLTISFQLTKRSIHAAIGYCEGVCTASDTALWDNPDFLQLIIWGEDRQARGGVHILIAKAEDKECLFLPGINPAMSLLKEAGAEAVFDAIITFAINLAKHWGLHGVLIPTSQFIASNRGLIHSIINGREYSQRDIPVIPFSYAPHRYNIGSVYVVWEKDSSQKQSN